MKIGRRVPPASAMLAWSDLARALASMLSGADARERVIQELRDYFGVRHVYMVSSGKAALTLILKGLQSVSKRSKVLIPAYTCFSVPSAVVKAGLSVSLYDVDPATLDFAFPAIERKLNDDVLCVVPNHLFGIASRLETIAPLCAAKGIFVVEDAAQAMGVSYKGKKLGTIGDVGFFSLGRGKNITCGSGGIIITNSDDIARAIEPLYENLPDAGAIESIREWLEIAFMTILSHPLLYWIPDGLPFLRLGETRFYKDFPVKKLSRMKGGYLRHWTLRLEESNRRRSSTAARFAQRLGAMAPKADDIPYLRLPVLLETRDLRDELYSIGRDTGLGVSVMYPTAVHEIEEIKHSFNGETFPLAGDLLERLLTLPTHHRLSERDTAAICRMLSARRAGGVPQGHPSDTR